MNIAFARSSTGLAVRAGAPKPDIRSPEKLKNVLLAAGAVSYSAGASGMHFVKIIERLGIAGEVAAKRVPPRAGERVGYNRHGLRPLPASVAHAEPSPVSRR